MTVPADRDRAPLYDPSFRAGPPWPPSVIEASRRLIMWTIERYQKEQGQAKDHRE